MTCAFRDQAPGPTNGRRGSTIVGADANRPLAGVKVVESSLLGPGLVTTFLADLGADVIKVEPPAGDYVRQMTWPIIEGNSLLHLHTHRGKRSICLDLKTEDGLEIYRDLVRQADVVVEAMRPGSLAKLGLGFEDLLAVISNWGACVCIEDINGDSVLVCRYTGLKGTVAGGLY